MGNSHEIPELLKSCRFDEAIPLMEQALREASAESSERLIEVARGIVAWPGIFGNTSEARASEACFRAVYRLLQQLAGAESPAAMAAAENLAGILGSIDQIEEAIVLREKVFASVIQRFPADDPRLQRVRDGLVFLYRQTGREDKIGDLYRNLGLCEHLTGALQYILGHGAQIVSCGQPWSKNCHIWVYFDALLDCERLKTGLSLEPCVQIHDHRGTHDGRERGLVCTAHYDALMGLHPSEAGPQTKTITRA
ncbi:MAG TPA: hypothetical protein VKV95_05165 [Terriglobia bacterium]|nr:hypothetical protein [Terriglobia bacterium]